MSFGLYVTGTDTGIGKTIFSAALAGATGAPYWKPIQAGLEDETDSETVAKFLPVRSMGRGTAREASGGGATAVAPKPLRQSCGLPPPHGFGHREDWLVA